MGNGVGVNQFQQAYCWATNFCITLYNGFEYMYIGAVCMRKKTTIQ